MGAPAIARLEACSRASGSSTNRTMNRVGSWAPTRHNMRPPYMHSFGMYKILFGSFKPSYILLDDNFVPKISDLGISRLIDKEHTANVIGDMTYMDPVYLQTGLLTLKSDVYSFGVVILELISRKNPTDDVQLVRSFIKFHKKGKKATKLFDKDIAVTTGDLELLDCVT